MNYLAEVHTDVIVGAKFGIQKTTSSDLKMASFSQPFGWNLLAQAGYRVHKQVLPYVQVGIGSVKSKYAAKDDTQSSASTNHVSLAFGAGVKVDLSNHFELDLNYLRKTGKLAKDKTNSLSIHNNQFTAGLNYYFY